MSTIIRLVGIQKESGCSPELEDVISWLTSQREHLWYNVQHLKPMRNWAVAYLRRSLSVLRELGMRGSGWVGHGQAKWAARAWGAHRILSSTRNLHDTFMQVFPDLWKTILQFLILRLSTSVKAVLNLTQVALSSFKECLANSIMLEQRLLDERITRLTHLFQAFLDFRHLLMFSTSLGGVRASTTVRVREVLR